MRRAIKRHLNGSVDPPPCRRHGCGAIAKNRLYLPELRGWRLLRNFAHTLGPGARVDGIDYDRKIIYELKPNNTRAIRRGIKQLERYIRIKGDGWRGELITYD